MPETPNRLRQPDAEPLQPRPNVPSQDLDSPREPPIDEVPDDPGPALGGGPKPPAPPKP